MCGLFSQYQKALRSGTVAPLDYCSDWGKETQTSWRKGGLQDGRTWVVMEDIGKIHTSSCAGGPQPVFNGAVRAPRACVNRIKGVTAKTVHVYSSETRTLSSSAVKCKEVDYLLEWAWSYKVFVPHSLGRMFARVFSLYPLDYPIRCDSKSVAVIPILWVR